jgi:two-component system OmpR family sensor kinase
VSASLQRQLSLTLAGVIVAAGLAAAAGSFVAGYYEVQELQDDTLRQISALAPSATPYSDKENESRILVMRLPSDSRPKWLPARPAPGFQTFEGEPERMRAFVRVLPSGETVVVAQATNVRDELALNSALRTLVPLLLLIPLLAWLTARVVARKLAPVRGLAAGLDGQSADRLQTLSDAGIPEEIASFVHAINRLLERVNRLMSEQRRFVADAAHELRSPLAAAMAEAENGMRAADPETWRQLGPVLLADLGRLSTLMDDLLALARLDDPAHQSNRRLLDLDDIVLAEIARARQSTDHTINAAAVSAAQVTADPGAMTRIVRNLLDNAARHAHSRLAVTLGGNNGTVQLTVADDGPGIPLEDRDRVFTRFTRLDDARDRAGGGAGLGLAIVRELVAAHGGRVRVGDPQPTDRDGVYPGAWMYVELPRALPIPPKD